MHCPRLFITGCNSLKSRFPLCRRIFFSSYVFPTEVPENTRCFVFLLQVCLLGDCMGALLAYDALTSSVNTVHSRTQSFISNTTTLSPKSASFTPQQTTESNGGVTRKPRRISSHTPPCKSSLENSRNLRLSLSSGNIRENVDPETDEMITSPLLEEMDENVMISPRPLTKAARLNTFSFDTMSLSIESVDHVMFDFEVSKFFAFGSPIGLVLAYRRFLNGEDRGGLGKN